MCIWTSAGDLIFRKALSTEAALWNLDYADELQTLFTCGGDSNIHQIQLQHIFDGRVCESELLPRIVSNTNGDEEYFSKIRITSGGILVGLTNSNRLFYRKHHDMGDWLPIADDAVWPTGLKCTLLKVHGDSIAIAGYKQAVVYRCTDGRFHVAFSGPLSNGLIRSFEFLATNEYLVCDDRGECTLALLDHNSGTIAQQCHFTLPLSRERWITAATKLNTNLLASDRCGHLHLFKIDSTTLSVQLLHTLKHVHGKLGCTSIVGHALGDSVACMTAGHDGTLKTVVIEANRLHIGCTRRVPIVWIEKVLPATSNDHLIAGFNDNHFVLGHANGATLFEYECGGGHRYWDIYIDHAQSLCYFYYLRNKNVHQIRFRIDVMRGPYDLPQTRWHIRPCNVIQVHRHTDDLSILVSGGDDNLLMFHSIDTIGKLTHHNDMALHVSNIKTVCTIAAESSSTDDGSSPVLVFSAGGRAQICATTLDVQQAHTVSLREHTNFMLNFSDSTRKRLGKAQTIDFDPETRFMGLIAYRRRTSTSPVYLIAACSDGYIRQFQYDNQTITMTLCIFYGRCILSVHQLRWKDQHLLFTMATDGLICVWDLNTLKADSVPVFNVRHHESGINAFDLVVTEDGALFVATGGDDQSIVISEIELNMVDAMFSLMCKRTMRLKDIHSAQVNGVKFMPDRQSLCSFSVDQVIYRIALSDFSAERVAWSSVSDAKGIAVLSSRQVLAYGSGFELINC